MPIVSVSRPDWQALAARALELVTAQEALPGKSGAAKRRAVVNTLAAEVDDLVAFGDGPVGRVFESLDGFVGRLVLTALVEGVVAVVKANALKLGLPA